MPPQADPVPHPWRRFLRFSVRGLIVLVLVIGAGLGRIVRQAHIQRDAVAAIRKAGGTVVYSWEHGNTFPRVGGPWARSRLADLSGVDFFDHVTDVYLSGSLRPADTTLAEAGRLNHLERLFLKNASVTDAGLVHLKGLTNLSALMLTNTRVTDGGLVHLKGLTNLYWLDLGHTGVTDVGLHDLEGLSALSLLGVGGTQVTDAGVDELKRAQDRPLIQLPSNRPAIVP
jgi:internalin A